MNITISAAGCNTPLAAEYMDPANPLFICDNAVTEDLERELFLYLDAKRRTKGLNAFESTIYVVTGKRQIRRLLGITEL